MNPKHLDRLIDPVHYPSKQPPIDGSAQRVPRGRGLRRADIGHQDLVAVPRGGDGNGATREAVVELMDVTLEYFTSVIEL